MKLCRNCREAHVVKEVDGDIIVKEAIYCDERGRRVNFNVTSCNRFDHAGSPLYHEMKHVAWVVNADRKTGRITGFEPPKKPDHYGGY